MQEISSNRATAAIIPSDSAQAPLRGFSIVFFLAAMFATLGAPKLSAYPVQFVVSGTFGNSGAQTITGGSSTATTITVNVASTAGFSVGQAVTVGNANPKGFNVNGATITSV